MLFAHTLLNFPWTCVPWSGKKLAVLIRSVRTVPIPEIRSPTCSPLPALLLATVNALAFSFSY